MTSPTTSPLRRITLTAVGIFALFGGTVASLPTAFAADDEAAFVARYRTDVAGVLATIHADKTHEDHRDAVFSLHGDPAKYVKCALIGKDTRIECDASSGYFSAPEGQPRLYKIAHDGREALKALGYDLDDSQGDFQIFLPLATDADLTGAADIVLKTLYEIYAVRPPAQIVDVTAPLAVPQPRPLAEAK